MSRNRSILLGCGLLLLVFLCGGLVFASGYGIVNLLSSRFGAPAYDVAVQVYPTRVYKDDVLELLVTIHNQGSRVMVVDSVTLPADLLTGAELRTVEPAEQGRAANGEILFDLPIAPGSSVTISFELDTQQPGNYQGDLRCEGRELFPGYSGERRHPGCTDPEPAQPNCATESDSNRSSHVG